MINTVTNINIKDFRNVISGYRTDPKTLYGHIYCPSCGLEMIMDSSRKENMPGVGIRSIRVFHCSGCGRDILR